MAALSNLSHELWQVQRNRDLMYICHTYQICATYQGESSSDSADWFTLFLRFTASLLSPHWQDTGSRMCFDSQIMICTICFWVSSYLCVCLLANNLDCVLLNPLIARNIFPLGVCFKFIGWKGVSRIQRVKKRNNY